MTSFPRRRTNYCFFLCIFRPSLTSCAAPAVSRTFLPKLGNSLKFISSSHSVARTPLPMSRQKVVRLPGFIDTGGVRHPYFGLLPFCLMYPGPRGVPWSDTISCNQPSWFHCFRKLPKTFYNVAAKIIGLCRVFVRRGRVATCCIYCVKTKQLFSQITDILGLLY